MKFSTALVLALSLAAVGTQAAPIQRSSSVPATSTSRIRYGTVHNGHVSPVDNVANMVTADDNSYASTSRMGHGRNAMANSGSADATGSQALEVAMLSAALARAQSSAGATATADVPNGRMANSVPSTSSLGQINRQGMISSLRAQTATMSLTPQQSHSIDGVIANLGGTSSRAHGTAHHHAGASRSSVPAMTSSAHPHHAHKTAAPSASATSSAHKKHKSHAPSSSGAASSSSHAHKKHKSSSASGTPSSSVSSAPMPTGAATSSATDSATATDAASTDASAAATSATDAAAPSSVTSDGLAPVLNSDPAAATA